MRRRHGQFSAGFAAAMVALAGGVTAQPQRRYLPHPDPAKIVRFDPVVEPNGRLHYVATTLDRKALYQQAREVLEREGEL